MWRSALSLLALGFAVALFGSCGGGDGASSDPQTRAADAARARHGAFRLADFPGDWRVDRAHRPRTACRDYEQGLTRTARRVTAFTQGDLLDADSTVIVFASEAQARQAFARLGAPALRRCYERDVARKARALPAVRSGRATFGDIRARPISSRDYGDETAALRLVVPLTQGTTQLGLRSDSVIVRVARAIVIANFSTVNQPFDARLMAKLLRAASARLAA